MLLLRALLDTVGAAPNDTDHNIATIKAMFPSPASAITQRSSATPAARTIALIGRQLAVHQRLWVMSEGYTTNDTRTVRSVSVSELDDMYDIVQEACSTNLFALRAEGNVVDDHHSSVSESAGDGGKKGLAVKSTSTAVKVTSDSDSSDTLERNGTALPVSRLLLLNALLINCTFEELKYFSSKLPAEMQQHWITLSRSMQNK